MASFSQKGADMIIKIIFRFFTSSDCCDPDEVIP